MSRNLKGYQEPDFTWLREKISVIPSECIMVVRNIDLINCGEESKRC